MLFISLSSFATAGHFVQYIIECCILLLGKKSVKIIEAVQRKTNLKKPA